MHFALILMFYEIVFGGYRAVLYFTQNFWIFEIFATTEKDRWTIIAVVSNFYILFFVHCGMVLDSENLSKF